MAGCFSEDGGVVAVEVIELGVPDVAVVGEVLLSATVGNLFPEWSVGSQPVEQAVSIPVADRFCGVLVRALWRAAHRDCVGRLRVK